MRVWDRSKRVVVALGSLVVVACGGETNGGSSCTAPAACGGDIIGKWRITSTCIAKAVQDVGCGTVTVQSFEVTGTVEFGADGSEISLGTSNQSGRYSFPAGCLKQPCADTAAVLDAQKTVDESPAQTNATCTASADTCVCDVSVVIQSNDHDTYTVSGNRLTTTSGATGEADPGTYCVQGNDLSVASDSGIVFHATRE